MPGMDKVTFFQQSLQTLGDREYKRDSPTGKACDLWFPSVMHEALNYGAWSFATKTTELPPEEDGTYTLEIPYANPTELAMDILRWGERVEVLEPAELRQKIRQILETALQQYAEPETPKVTGKPRRKPMEP